MTLDIKVTILLSTYNRAHLIGETLDSILAQTYNNWECFIIDDNSTDNTEEFLNVNYLQDKRFSYFKKDLLKYPEGLPGSRNMSLDLAIKLGAKYIQFFDDDDIMHPKKIEYQIKPFNEDGNLDLTFCRYRTFGSIDTVTFDLDKAEDYSSNIKTSNIFWDFYYNKIRLNSLGPIWKLDSVSNYRFDERLTTGEERDFYLRLFFKENIKFKTINKILFWYRKQHQSITSNKNDFKSKQKSLKIISNKILKMMILSKKTNSKLKLKFLFKLIKNIY